MNMSAAQKHESDDDAQDDVKSDWGADSEDSQDESPKESTAVPADEPKAGSADEPKVGPSEEAQDNSADDSEGDSSEESEEDLTEPPKSEKKSKRGRKAKEGRKAPRGKDDVLGAYRKLASRRVDLVGDYAGDEFFLIEGDSLLLRCLDDDRLDFDSGLQLLHAAYNVEHFLKQLIMRKCNFNITFFDCNKTLCIPPGTHPSNVSKYLLAREALLRHLQSNLSKSHPDTHVNVFPSWDSDAFRQYLTKSAPYFIMAHDGARAVDRKGKHMATETGSNKRSDERLALRTMILSFLAQHYNVALVNGLEWRDTKIMTTVLETRKRDDIVPTAAAGPQHQSASQVDVTGDLEKLGGVLTRESLAVLTVAQVLRDAAADGSSSSRPQLTVLYLLHTILLSKLPLAARRVPVVADHEQQGDAAAFLQVASNVAATILASSSQSGDIKYESADIIDLVDGRLFLHLVSTSPALDTDTKGRLENLISQVKEIIGTNLEASGITSTSSKTPSDSSDPAVPSREITVLPFSNRVFDKHLESVSIRVESEEASEKSLASRKIFQEVTHWHNAKRPLVKKGPPTPQEERMAKKVAKREQLFMAEMRTYAASLTNAVGKSLEPETIIVGVARQSTISGTTSAADSEVSDSSASGKGKQGGKKVGGGGGKNASKNASKQAMLNQIAAAKAKKDESASDKIFTSWQLVCKGFEADKDMRSRYRKAKDFRANMQSSWKEILSPEIELYQLNALLLFWIETCKRKEQGRGIEITALIWSHARSIATASQLTKTIVKDLELTISILGLPPLGRLPEASTDRKLAFTFALPSKVENLAVNLPSREFQLLECGPYLERNFDSKPDPRVDFEPDAWQRKVLDSIDANQSTFVVAPTSAGKTFISFYAMRKVLEADDDSVLVYVAPTKALVNQIAAEIQARYSKKFKYGGKSVWAIHTRDYRINNPTGCQVLVTVPHVLQIMLLAPTNANSWSSRVKRIIFDEVHSIGQAEDGVVWEQLLLMAPCPIIALSATVGNPGEFSDWLKSTQAAIGKELVTVNHPHRYSHLRKYYYVPPKEFSFQGIPDKVAFGVLGLEGLTGFNHVHPVAALLDKSRGIPEDLALEPRDCFQLWKAMVKVQTSKHAVPASLDPTKALPEVSRNVDILKWAEQLQVTLKAWLADDSSPFDQLVTEVDAHFHNETREKVYTTTKFPDAGVKAEGLYDIENPRNTTLAMLCRLQEQDALPAILFNYDRTACEDVCQTVLTSLEEAERLQKKSGAKWTRTLERFEEWKELKEKTDNKAAKMANKKTTKKGKEDDGDEKTSKLDQQKEAAGGEDTKWESFNPDAPLEGYHFADYSRVQMSELDIYVRQLRYRDVPEFLIQSLRRGVGVHHAGMNRKYRQVVEIMFRKGFLRVIVATGTLALGINMPCKTVVFSGDSVFLTALNYRQCAGRAGRRGFDLLGNVVFQGVTRQKVCRLISSRLPDLNGHFPITTTLVLRLFTLLTDSNYAKYSTSAINALLTQPRLYMGGPSFKDQTMHHLRFSIEYLRRQQLLGSDGAPLNFAGLVSHLYFTENSSFAFHALLKEGYFHELCADITKNEKGTLETLMLVMAHLFNRVVCRQADIEYIQKVVKPSSSIVFLPPLPKPASKILMEHNKQTLDVYRSYVKTFVDQHLDAADDKLPLTGLSFAKDGGSSHGVKSLPETKIRSPFVALSGAGDDFESIHDLCTTTRDGVFLEEAVIPSMSVYPEEMEVPLNAWLLDFYKHGDVFTLEKANGIRRADIWFFLNDFSLVLATIIASLMNFMKLTAGEGDMDMLDVMGNLDAHEEQEDDRVAASETQSTTTGSASVADSAIDLPSRTAPGGYAATAVANKKAKKQESWEDTADAEEEIAELRRKEIANVASEAQAREASAAWEGGEGGEGLKNVLRAFQKLHFEFNVKFRAMWA